MAAVHGHAVIQRRLALHLLLITGIRQPSVRLEEDGWAKVLLGVPPVGWAGCGTAGAQNALVQTVEFLALLHGLEVLLSLVFVSLCCFMCPYVALLTCSAGLVRWR